MNYKLLLTTALLTAGPIDVGMAAYAAIDATTVQVSEVEFLQQESSGQQDVIIVDSMSTGERDIIWHNFYKYLSPNRIQPDGDAYIITEPDALKVAVDVEVAISSTPQKTYPTIPGFDQSYRTDDISYIGPSLTAKIPLDALDWQGEEKKTLLVLRPSFFEGALDEVAPRDVFIEVRLKRADGTLVFFPFDYGFGGEANITNLFLQTSLEGGMPEVLEINAQAVDLSGVLPDSSRTPQRNGISVQSLSLPDEDPALPTFLNGLYHIDVDAVEAASTFSTCDQSSAAGQSIPLGFKKVTGMGTLPNGKTPLVLVHGWTALGQVVGSLQESFGLAIDDIVKGTNTFEFPDELINQTRYMPASCYWEDFILNFTNKDSNSAALSALRQEYELYSFGYDSIGNSVEENAYLGKESLANSLRTAFGSKEAVVVAHSMGGLVTNTHIQNSYGNDNVKKLIGAGTPYMGKQHYALSRTDL